MFFKKIPDRDQIHAILDESGASSFLEGFEITQDRRVIVTLMAAASDPEQLEGLRSEIERKISSVKHVAKAIVILTAQREVKPPQFAHPKGPLKTGPLELPNIKRIIAVASGKGGVGKSTVSANLAVAFAQQGMKVGLLDADIYGPSVPRLMGIRDQKPENQNGKLIPLEKYGLKIMSMGFMVSEEAAMIWRGPMIQTALTQLLRDVDWGELDILVIDLPPGTGDAQLTLAQKVPVTGAVIVSTPQDLALIDARKAVEMFKKLSVPILGLIENMSYYKCINCGHEDHIFGHGGAQAEADKIGCPFLGEIPLDADIRKSADEGQPYNLSEIYREIAERIALAK